MARVKDQDIPPWAYQNYRIIFASTSEVSTNWNHHTGLKLSSRFTTRRRYNPSDTISPKQRKINLAFRTVSAWLDASPYNERRCYYRLGLKDSWQYGRYYRHRNVGPRYRDTASSEILRPDAMNCPPAWTPGIAYANYAHEEPDTLQLVVDAELDPAEYWDWYGSLSPNPYVIYHYWETTATPWQHWAVLWAAAPTARTRYRLCLQVPDYSDSYIYREVTFIRQSKDLTAESVLWQFYLEGVTPSEYLYGFERATEE